LDLRTFDLRLLIVLDALFEEPTVSRAAKRLLTTQPTVSAALAKLRDVFDDELFVRSQGVMRPTARAMSLRDPVRNILRSVQHDVLAKSGFDAAASRETFVISLSDIGELEFLPALIQHLAQVAPGVRVKAVTCNPEALADAMDAGEIDLAVGFFPDLTTAVFKQQVLFTHGTAVLVRAGHPDFADTISLDQYRAARHLAVQQQSRRRDVVAQALEQHEITREVVLTVSHYVNVPALVAQSDLIATIAEPLARWFVRHYPLKLLNVPFKVPKFEIKQLWHRRFDHSERLMWLRSAIASLSQNRPHL